jgi:hypothetical protein
MNRRPIAISALLFLCGCLAGRAGEPEPMRGNHWSYQAVSRPAVPAVHDSHWARGEIDRFIQAALEKARLTPAAEAGRETLIRRLKLDLLGLPPAPEEVDAFLRDPDPLAYPRLVERYLASPHFGERWARHWLDVVRFAESDGFETNQPRPSAWPYRDYVIRAFNQDTPYDRFILEQLAGDQLGVDEATGFLVAGAVDRVKSPDPVLTAQQRADELHDMVATTTSAFLGLTAGCARCHDHKFDPVPQADYYALKAVFAGVQHGERPLRSPDEARRRDEAVALRRGIDALSAAQEALEPLARTAGPARRRPVNPRRNLERFAPVRARFIRFTVLATNNLEPCLDELELFSADAPARNVALASAGTRATSSGNYAAAPQIHRLEFINDGLYGNSHSWISNQTGAGWVQLELKEPVLVDRLVWGRDREGKFTDRLATRYRIEVALEPEKWQLVASSDDRSQPGSADEPILEGKDRETYRSLATERVALERRLAEVQRAGMVYAGTFAPPEPTYRFHRGDPMQKRELASPASLSRFGPVMHLSAEASESRRRLELARWIASAGNPLTARVIVNRIWHYHFGTGLVDTPSDFGRNGARPSHPELLDWLADELVAHGWSLKHIHRQIVLSAAYRQDSASRSDALAADALTRLLWRFPPRRLEAEALRDSILWVSGNLDLRMGGPGFDLFEPNSNYVKVYNSKKQFGPDESRRLIYQNKPRMQLDDTFGSFDCPDGGQITPRRTHSTTALQALNLFNGRFLVQQAQIFAGRVEREVGPGAAAQVQRAFLIALQRRPEPEVATAALELVRQYGLSALCRALFNANEFVFLR